MFDYREVVRCKECGKIYDLSWQNCPYICYKCGNKLYKPENKICENGEHDHDKHVGGFLEIFELTGGEKLIAKPQLRGWKVRE